MSQRLILIVLSEENATASENYKQAESSKQFSEEFTIVLTRFDKHNRIALFDGNIFSGIKMRAKLEAPTCAARHSQLDLASGPSDRTVQRASEPGSSCFTAPWQTALPAMGRHRKAWSRNRSRICLFRRELHTWKACSQWRQSKSTSEVWLLAFKAEIIAHFGADIETSIGNISCGAPEVILLQLLEASQNPTAKSITYQGFASSPCKVRRVPERNFPS